jgi:hypothetical protein
MLMNYLADNLKKISVLPFGEILKGLGVAAIAIAAFGALVMGIGFLVTTLPVMAGAGIIGLLALTYAMGYLADNLLKFNTINSDQLLELGKSLSVLSLGLVSFLVGGVAGSVGGIVTGLTSLFGLDPATQIKKFETIDSDKILKLGTGLKYMAEGLKMLASGLDFNNLIKDIKMMIDPLNQFSVSVETFSRAYDGLQKVRMNTEYNINLDKDNSIQKAILDMNTQELAIQEQQLAQLRINGDYLKNIANNGISNSSNTVSNDNRMQIINSSFTTKANHLDNIRLASAYI